ncbi:glycosyltransferase family 2 protein [Lysinibacillus boronitolerans]|uniref:glycosyltransferase family 2 protein n=1 Tax=Lysinibacillus boronitolerans TaxID=309788 RepID=UPI002161D9DD|nr:glycosyltransferase family 2 protein [Lysinibacillus boronitolerans]MCS1394262.1 glycosyltransferase family 2 protein [Lysinibacillus boronitolerans]
MDLSIVIVNYNTKKLTLECIKSIYNANKLYDVEIIVVDNASSDDSVSAIKNLFPRVHIIENQKNVGFSKANNQAICTSDARYVLLLNSDTIVKKDSLSTIIEYMDVFQDVGAVGCEVNLADGTLDKACHRGFPTPDASFYYMIGLAQKYPTSPKYNSYHKSYLNMKEIHDIDCLVGAFMMVRREVIEQVGLLDEEFFMYGEDIDWCYRIKEAGWRIVYNPTVSITHYKGASSRKKPFKIVYEFHRAMYIFHKKHFAKKYNFFVNSVVYTGITLKLTLATISNLLKRVH